MAPKDPITEFADLRAEMRDWVRKDQADHAEIRGEVKELRKRVDETRDLCFETREETVRQTTALDGIAESLREMKETKKAEAASKTDKHLKVWLWFMGILGSLGTGVALHFLTK